MADSKRTDNTAFSPFGEAHKYFTENVLPKNIQARTRRIRMASSYVHNKEQTFILVTGGTGTLTVNGLDYRLRPGTLVNLGPFHIYRYTPDKGEILELIDSRMNSGAYMYLVANPYFRIPKFIVPSEPPVVYLKGVMKEIAYQSMEGLLAECARGNEDRDSICLCYMTDLFGIVTDEAVRSVRKSRDGQSDKNDKARSHRKNEKKQP